MKAREAFERIRNQRNRFNLPLRLTLLVSAEMVFSVLLAHGISFFA